MDEQVIPPGMDVVNSEAKERKLIIIFTVVEAAVFVLVLIAIMASGKITGGGFLHKLIVMIVLIGMFLAILGLHPIVQYLILRFYKVRASFVRAIISSAFFMAFNLIFMYWFWRDPHFYGYRFIYNFGWAIQLLLVFIGLAVGAVIIKKVQAIRDGMGFLVAVNHTTVMIIMNVAVYYGFRYVMKLL